MLLRSKSAGFTLESVWVRHRDPPRHQLVHLRRAVFMGLSRRQLLRLRLGRGDDLRLKVAQQIAEVGVLVRRQTQWYFFGKSTNMPHGCCGRAMMGWTGTADPARSPATPAGCSLDR